MLKILLSLLLTISPMRFRVYELVVKENRISGAVEIQTVEETGQVAAIYRYSPNNAIYYACYHFSNGNIYGYHDIAHRTN